MVKLIRITQMFLYIIIEAVIARKVFLNEIDTLLPPSNVIIINSIFILLLSWICIPMLIFCTFCRLFS